MQYERIQASEGMAPGDDLLPAGHPNLVIGAFALRTYPPLLVLIFGTRPYLARSGRQVWQPAPARAAANGPTPAVGARGKVRHAGVRTA